MCRGHWYKHKWKTNTQILNHETPVNSVLSVNFWGVCSVRFLLVIISDKRTRYGSPKITWLNMRLPNLFMYKWFNRTSLQLNPIVKMNSLIEIWDLCMKESRSIIVNLRSLRVTLSQIYEPFYKGHVSNTSLTRHSDNTPSFLKVEERRKKTKYVTSLARLWSWLNCGRWKLNCRKRNTVLPCDRPLSKELIRGYSIHQI